jgi:ABC-type glycerol-3-phosphate transport system substrate-binding protein
MDAYTALHPNVTFKYELVPYDQFQTQLITRALAGDAPELTQGGYNTAQLAVGNLLVPLDDYLAQDSINKDDYWKALWEIVEWDGKTFGFPFTIDCRMNLINDQLVSDIGATVPVTWDDALALGGLGQDRGIAPLAICIPSGAFGVWGPGGGFLKSNEGNWLQINDDGTATSLLTDQAVGETVQFMKDLVDRKVTQDGVISEQYADVNNLFFQQQAAMYIQGNWMLKNMDDLFDKGEITFKPSQTDAPYKKRKGAVSGGWSWQVATTIKDPAVGWDVIRFFNDDDNVDTGWPDSLPPAKKNMELPFWAADPRTPFVASVLGYSEWPVPPVIGWYDLLDVIWRNVLVAVSGQAPLDKALADGSLEVQDVLDKGHNAQVLGG